MVIEYQQTLEFNKKKGPLFIISHPHLPYKRMIKMVVKVMVKVATSLV